MPPVRRSKRLRKSPIGVESAKRATRSHGQNPEGNPSPPKKCNPKPSYLQRSLADIERDPNRTLRLLSLPRELFDEIVARLPPSSEACLTLTCKAALHAIGTASWTYFRRSTQLSYRRTDTSLHELLKRDNPELQLCPRCQILHPPIKAPHAHRTTKFTSLCLGQGASVDYWPQTPSGTYTVVYTHINEAFQSRPKSSARNASATPIDLFTGDFTTKRGKANYRLRSSASWVDGNLILRQEHRLSSSVPRSRLHAVAITSLPFRVCAHLSTSTAPTPESQRTRHHVPNGSLLTRAVASAFPASRRRGVAPGSTFRESCPFEQAQIEAGSRQKGFVWWCRSCPTKFRVEYDADSDELVVTAWHCFGRDLHQARKFWKWLVRREGALLGPKKRNSEYYAFTKSIPDFVFE
ncbi:uncharacterized protein BDV17DRAFT_39020 [Aspergillus undulatus]|uniref:uncharacterized protein n=1 Tax=Aspergillus undulatus TaxID=1810928 RepID=UPI003CCE1DFF